ncbi:MAG: AAA family ATPase, partial [Nocardioidaceae bacterium]
MTLSVLIAAGGATWESDAVVALEQAREVSRVRRCVDVLDLVATAASGHAHAALLSIDLPGLDTDVVQRLVEARVTPIGVADRSDPYVAARFDALGVTARAEVGDLGRIDDLVVTSTERPDSPAELGTGAFDDVERPADRGRVVTVWGPTGAPGRSTVALGFACEAAAAGTPALLIDADTYGGSIAQMLAVLDEVSGLLAAARSADTGSLGPADLARHVRQVDKRLAVLTGVGRADRWPQLRVGSFDRILEVARQLAPVVVVDAGFCIETDEELSYDTAAPRRNAVTIRAL